MLTPLQRFGVKRWSPPGRLARKIAPKPARKVRPICPFCFQAGIHRSELHCLSALSSPEQRALQHGSPGARGW